jgi:hypothetical protein
MRQSWKVNQHLSGFFMAEAHRQRPVSFCGYAWSATHVGYVLPEVKRP